MRLRSWGLRVMFVGLIVAGGASQLTGQTRADPGRFDAAVTHALTQAGFTVATHTQTWLAGKIKGSASLVARHPDCRAAIVVTSGSVAAAPSADGGMSTLIYGDLHAAALPRLAIVGETARLELHWAMALGRHHRPPRRLLMVQDPSACLLLTDPHWQSVWSGDG